MTEWAIAVGLLAAPLLPLAFSHPAGLERVRDWWLLGVLGLSVLLAPLWLAPLLAWYAWRWSRVSEPWSLLPDLTVLVTIALTWILLRRMPAEAWEFVAYGWVAGTFWYIARLAQNGLRLGWRSFGTRTPANGLLGSPVMLAMLVALTLPFAPIWLWPVYALGLWVTCSGMALLSIAAGATLYYWPV